MLIPGSAYSASTGLEGGGGGLSTSRCAHSLASPPSILTSLPVIAPSKNRLLSCVVPAFRRKVRVSEESNLDRHRGAGGHAQGSRLCRVAGKRLV